MLIWGLMLQSLRVSFLNTPASSPHAPTPIFVGWLAMLSAAVDGWVGALTIAQWIQFPISYKQQILDRISSKVYWIYLFTDSDQYLHEPFIWLTIEGAPK